MDRKQFREIAIKSFKVQPKYNFTNDILENADFFMNVYGEKSESIFEKERFIEVCVKLGSRANVELFSDLSDDDIIAIMVEKTYDNIRKEFRSVDEKSIRYLSYELGLDYSKVRYLLSNLDLAINNE